MMQNESLSEHDAHSVIHELIGESDVIRFLLKERIAEKEFLEKRRITLEEVAKSIGISRNTLSRITSTYGYSTTTDVVDKLCGYFACPVSGIIEHVQDDKP